MLRHYTVVLAVVCVVIYSWLCTQMIPLLALRTEPVLVVPRRAIAVMKTRREARRGLGRKQFAHRVDMWDDGVQVARQCRRAGSPGGMRLLRTERAPSTADARSERETDGVGNEAWRFVNDRQVVNRTNAGSLASRRGATVIRQR